MGLKKLMMNQRQRLSNENYLFKVLTYCRVLGWLLMGVTLAMEVWHSGGWFLGCH